MEAVRNRETLQKHADWIAEVLERNRNLSVETIHSVLQTEIGTVFVKVLEDAGVFKWTEKGHEDIMRFLVSI